MRTSILLPCLLLSLTACEGAQSTRSAALPVDAVEGVLPITVSNPAGDVRVRHRPDADQIKVTAQVEACQQARADGVQIRIATGPAGIEVYPEWPRTGDPDCDAAHLLVEAPAADGIVVDTRDGSIEVERGFNGALDLTTTGGNVEARHSGPITVQANGGRVQLNGSEAITVSASDAWIGILAQTGPVVVRNTNRSVNVAFTTPAAAEAQGFDLSTSGGQLRVSLRGFEGQIRGSASGELSLPEGPEFQADREGSAFTLQVGDGDLMGRAVNSGGPVIID